MAYRNSSIDMPGRIAHMRALSASEPGPGVLAYVDGSTAGWCSVAPKSAYRALVRSRTIPHVQDEGCLVGGVLVVRPGFRRRGLMHELLLPDHRTTRRQAPLARPPRASLIRVSAMADLPDRGWQ
jgi:hypothetical protein